jgi:hypothetical protein
MVRILRYTTFPLVFLLSLMLCGKILAPILGFFFSFCEIVASLLSSEPPNFLWEFVIEPAIISGICGYCSFMLALLVYPGDNRMIPIVICSSILIVILIFYVIAFNTGINTLIDLNPNESFEDISKPRFYVSIFSTLVGYSYAVYTLLKR